LPIEKTPPFQSLGGEPLSEPPIEPRDFTGRDGWLSELCEATKDHRARRASHHEAEARASWREYNAANMERGKAATLADYERIQAKADHAKSRSRWHYGRARGQRFRHERTRACGREARIRLSCGSCEGNTYRARCGSALYCAVCRNRRATKQRQGFRRARRAAIEEARNERKLRKQRRGGRWGEKFLTLTGPHCARHTPRQRVAVFREAWRLFRRWMRDYWRERDAPGVKWYSAQEWTPGDDGKGHPHRHIWILCPFVADWPGWQAKWADLYERACRNLSVEEARPHPTPQDLRAVRGGDQAADELIKYITKDYLEGGKDGPNAGARVSPEVYGLVVEMYEGKRRLQGSRGFIQLGKIKIRSCVCCARSVVRYIITFHDDFGEGGGDRKSRAGPGVHKGGPREIGGRARGRSA
jgi:hypothetical protein